MNIFVLIKQVPDTETKIKLTSDTSNIEKNDIKWVINPYDEFAIEEALKTKEILKTGTVKVATLGPDRCVDALRTALAMGADDAIHIKCDQEVCDSYLVGKALAELLKKETADLILTGKQAIDDDQASVFGYVAELLNIPSVSVVVKTEVNAAAKTILVEREIDGGMKEKIQASLPCLVAVNKGINTPRYASLPGIMKAKKKEIKAVNFSDLTGGEGSTVKESTYQLPPERSAGKKIAGEATTQVKELVRLLREEAKVI